MYEIRISKEKLIELLKQNPDNDCVKTIEHIEIAGGLVHIVGEQHKIVNGEIIP